MKKIFFIVLISSLMQQLALADSRLVFKTTEDKLTYWSNDKYFRMKIPKDKESTNSPMSSGEMLADLRSGKTYMINDKEKIIVDVSNPEALFGGLPKAESSHQEAETTNYTYKKIGAGKKVAGIKTTKYHVIAQGKKCFEILMSKNKAFNLVMKRLDSVQSGDDDGHHNNDDYNNSDDICEQVENQMDDDKMAQYGYPVKATNAKGIVQYEVLEFKTNVKAPKNYLAFPKGYKVKTMMELMKEAFSQELMKKFGQ